MKDTNRRRFDRRRFLKAVTASSVAAVAGCQGRHPRADADHPVTGTVTSWSGFRGDRHNTGFARGVAATSDDPTVAWTYEADGPFWGSPSVVDGTVYVGSTDHSVYALDAETGDERWSYATDNRVEATPAVADDTVYVGSYDMHVYAIDAATGEQRWARDLGGLVRGSPTVGDGTVYVGVGCHNLACAPFAEEAGVTGVGGIYALDADSGETTWRYDVSDEVVSTPATDGERVYVGASDETLYALNADSGEPEWTYEVGDMIWSSPALAFGTVYFGDWDGLVHAVDATTGEEQWYADVVAHYISGSVAVDEETVYVGDTPLNSLDDPSPNYGTMMGLDRTTGEELWAFETPAFEIGSSPVVSEDRLYFGTHGQTGSEDVGVYGLSTDGDEQWYMEIGGRGVGSSPVLLDGTLYFSATDGRVYAVE